MAVSITLYNKLRKYLADGTVDLDSDTIKLALVTSSYTPAPTTDDEWADVSANEVATGDGYTTGGEALTGLAVTETGGVATWDANDVTWTALTKTFRYGVLYVDDTKGAVTKPLIAYVLFDTTPADVSVAGIDFICQWHADGILTLS